MGGAGGEEREEEGEEHTETQTATVAQYILHIVNTQFPWNTNTVTLRPTGGRCPGQSNFSYYFFFFFSLPKKVKSLKTNDFTVL